MSWFLFLVVWVHGLGIVNATIIADCQYDRDASTKMANSLKDLIIQQSLAAQLPDVISRIHMDR